MIPAKEKGDLVTDLVPGDRHGAITQHLIIVPMLVPASSWVVAMDVFHFFGWQCAAARDSHWRV
jgi:hypothetical protein